MGKFVPTQAEIVYKGGKSYTIGRFTFVKEEPQGCDDVGVIVYCMNNSQFIVTVQRRRPVAAEAPVLAPALKAKVVRKTKAPVMLAPKKVAPTKVAPKKAPQKAAARKAPRRR